MPLSQKIWIICGGISEEREVSLRSGKNVYDSALRSGYKNAVLFDWKDEDSLLEIISAKRSGQIDKAVLLSHGNYGEDGCIQGLLEILAIPYTGSNHETSAICMNKTRTKEILGFHGLPVLKTYCAVEVLEKNPINTEFIVKPKSGGSSVGIMKFNSHKDFVAYCATHKEYTSQLADYFVEPFIKGTELTTSIVETKNLKVSNKDSFVLDSLASLPILELRPKNEFYDYEAKYTEGMTEFILPAQIPAELSTQIHQHAIKSFQILGCKSCARVDFIIDAKTNSPYILEVNTLPGMTNTSDLPAQAKAAGISYDELVKAIIESE